MGKKTEHGTHQVHHHIFVEGCPPLCSNIANIHHSFWVISVHVKNGGVYYSGNISGIGRGTGHPRVSGEADLRKHGDFLCDNEHFDETINKSQI